MNTMKKLLLISFGALLIPYLADAGGIVTNTNQSATWVRTLSRDASTGIDAVYFNPAGIVKLDNGFHFSLNSQTIWQSKDVTTTYPFLQPTASKKYEGDVFAPVFPSVYAAWKKGKFAVSFGFNPIGGGGGAEYKTGLASFESQVSTLPFLFTALSTQLGTPIQTTQYSADIYFKGSSIFFGYQLGLTYAINDMISAYLGARYVTAKNNYQGHISDIMLNPIIPGINPNGDMISAYGLFTNPALASTPYAAFASFVADKDIDVTEKGSSFCPIIGANISLLDKINVGIKYEFKTNLEVTQNINSGVEIAHAFEQDSVVSSNLPAMLSIGASVKPLPRLDIAAGFHYFFDKSANYGKTLDSIPFESVTNDKLMDKNYLELSLGINYGITEKLYASVGYLRSQTGVTEDYQSDLSYSLNSNTIGGGLGYKITKKIMVNIGASYSIYEDGEKNYMKYVQNPLNGAVIRADNAKDEYYKNALILAIGLDISF
jgi:long-chain fatty acid transport protein